MNVEISREGNEPDVASLVLTQLSRIDGAIEKEFTLVSDRMMWMVISESFIFGAFATAAVNYVQTTTHMGYLVVTLILTLPMLGITMAGFAWRAILAAHATAESLKEKREKLEAYLPEPIRVHLVSSKLPTHKMGNAPPRFLPPIIICVWLAFLVIAATELWAHQTIARRVTIAILTLILFVVLFFARRWFARRITQLEDQIRELKSATTDSKA